MHNSMQQWGPIQFFWIDFRSDPIAQKWIYILSDPMFQRWIGTLSISVPYPVDLIFISFYPAYLHVYPLVSNKFFKYQTNRSIIFKIMGTKKCCFKQSCSCLLEILTKNSSFLYYTRFFQGNFEKKVEVSLTFSEIYIAKNVKISKTWIWIGEKKFAYLILSDPEIQDWIGNPI